MTKSKRACRKASRWAGCRPVLVEWIDSAQSLGWVQLDETVGPEKILTIGFLTHKDRKRLVVTPTIARGRANKQDCPIAIPRVAVRRWRYLD